jgi:hypothetical protein
MNTDKLISKHYYSIAIALFFVSAVVAFLISGYSTPEVYSNPAIQKDSQNEIALIYVGCSTCGAAKDPELPETLRTLSEKLHRRASETNIEYMEIGISSEQDIERGLSHLGFSGLEYDEIAIGNGFGNSVLQRYIWDETESFNDLGIPQVIILKRSYDVQDYNGEPLIMPNLTKEEILNRSVSLYEIKTLLDDDEFFLSLH